MNTFENNRFFIIFFQLILGRTQGQWTFGGGRVSYISHISGCLSCMDQNRWQISWCLSAGLYYVIIRDLGCCPSQT